jgi:hypothetical protein
LPECSPRLKTILPRATAIPGAPRYRFLDDKLRLWKCWMLVGAPVGRFVAGSRRCAHRHGDPSWADQK